MKYFSKTAFSLSFTAAAVSACTNPGSDIKDRRPNIILIMSDDMGYSDIGCYGSEIRTPNLDNLAVNGLRYTRFYNTARSCPTRASLLTGLHPHQAGVGHMMENRGNPSYQGNLNDNCVTLAQVLKPAGYSTYMAGKWHVTPLMPSRENPDRKNWPIQRGFDRFFGTIHGAGSFYDPNTLTSGNKFITPGDNFYYTDAISDTVVKYIAEHDSKNPYFIYVAYTAAHWPLHALKKDVEKYKGVYDKGWDELRKERYKRMIDMGIISPDWPLSPANPDTPWENEEMKEWNAACMEVYAAMIDNMDQGIGRIVNKLKEKGEFDNTVILFLQDNGACAENYGLARPAKNMIKVDPDTLKPMKPDELQLNMEPLQTRDGRPVRVGRGVVPGDADTYISYDDSWANASNTPFRMFKHWINEGGISTPLIVSWPAGIQAKGEFRRQPGQLVDIMATLADLCKAEYPEEFNGNMIIPMQGMSLVNSFNSDKVVDRTLYWEHEGNRGIRKGNWKLVSEAWQVPQALDSLEVLPADFWELYDIEKDRSEQNNLSAKYPEMVKEMASKWQDWAEMVTAVPKPPVKLNVNRAVKKELEERLK
jgi:arylsulfatase